MGTVFRKSRGLWRGQDGADASDPTPLALDRVVCPHGLTLPITIAWPRRGVFALVGPNGSGKTQLLRVMAGLERPRSGRLTRDHSEPFYFVGADPDLQLSEEYVADEISWAFGASEWAQDRAISVLRAWGLGAMSRHRTYDLSTGQKRRLILAIAETLDPTVLLLDEPTEGLDVDGRAYLGMKLREWAESKLVVVASHDWPWLLRYIVEGYWCETRLDDRRDLADLWKVHRPPGLGPLAELFAYLLDQGWDVNPRAWIDGVSAAQEVTRCLKRGYSIP